MRRLWITLAVVLTLSFSVLGWIGTRIYQAAPPIPDRVVTTDGRVVFDSGEIAAGQDVWRSFGGMELGSIWGHGAYVAPDWTADWLHRELTSLLDGWARRDTGATYAVLDGERQAALQHRLTLEIRRNTFDPVANTIVVSPERATAIAENITYYTVLFANGNDDYAMPRGIVVEPVRAHQLAAFFFWTAWAASANRPGDTVTYTSNWPHEELIRNVPTSDSVVWTGVSILVLLGGIGALGFWNAARSKDGPPAELPSEDPMPACSRRHHSARPSSISGSCAG